MSQKKLEKVYLSLGGNFGNTKKVFKDALSMFSDMDQTRYLASSSMYVTSPVSTMPQFSYLNMVCSLETTLEPNDFFAYIESIEVKLGKEKKDKDMPRIIDIDILFFGNRKLDTPHLQIPHPKWQERLFVLTPLIELVKTIELEDKEIDIKEVMNRFVNKQKEVVTLFL